jgi:hypothetical protein
VSQPDLATENLNPLDHFEEDWAKIVLLESEEIRNEWRANDARVPWAAA